MQNFIDATRLAVQSRNWHGALVLSLTLPDICGRLASPTAKSGERYAQWFDEWVGPKYQSQIGADGYLHTFLSGANCYALRCAVLHEGREDISLRKARQSLSRFSFLHPDESGHTVHCNQFDELLQLDVSVFSLDLADGVQAWLASVVDNPGVQQGLTEMVVVRSVVDGLKER